MAVKIKANVMWACLQQVNEMSNKYQVDLCNLSEKAVKALEEEGVVARFREDQPDKGAFITVKSARPIRAYDPDGNEINSLVGNGSVASAVISTYAWTFKGKKGISPSLNKLVITDLVEYDESDVDDGEPEL